MRKRLIAIIALIVLGSMMIFASPAKEKSAETSGPIELKFWSLFTGGDGEFFNAMIDEFNASQNEIHMTNDMVRFDDYYTRLTTAPPCSVSITIRYMSLSTTKPSAEP